MALFPEMEQKLTKICLEPQNTPNRKGNFNEKEHSLKLPISCLQTTLKIYSGPNNASGTRDTQTDGPNKSHTQVGLIFDRVAKNPQEKDVLFNK